MGRMLSSERHGRVLLVRVDNPPLNFMNREMVAELDRLTRRLRRDRSLGAVVITGKPPELFVTHYEIAEILAGVESAGISAPPSVNAALLRIAAGVRHLPGLRSAAAHTPFRGLLEMHRVHDAFNRMTRLDKVFVAAINGPAAGGGCELALACDLRLMADAEIRIGLPEMTLGFNPGAGGTQRLTRLLGPGRALEMMLEGRTLDPGEAQRVGLVNGVIEPDRLLEVSLEAAERLARRAPAAIRGLKQAVYDGGSSRLRRGLAIERRWFMAEAGEAGSRRAMAEYSAWVERTGEAPWAGDEAMLPWQRGTAAELIEPEPRGEGD
jgi:enoyl-CoA hydratase